MQLPIGHIHGELLDSGLEERALLPIVVVHPGALHRRLRRQRRTDDRQQPSRTVVGLVTTGEELDND